MNILHEFEIAYPGWECDSNGAVFEDRDGTRYLTRRAYTSGLDTELIKEFSAKEGIEILKDRIKDYRRLTAEAQKAIDFLEGNNE